MANLKPLFDNVLIRRSQEGITAGGIHVPETSQSKTQTGAVVCVGDGKLLEDGSVRALKVRSGDRVVFGKYSGTDVDHNGEELLMVKESDILGIVENS
jgi:chaperonin GroES